MQERVNVERRSRVTLLWAGIPTTAVKNLYLAT